MVPRKPTLELKITKKKQAQLEIVKKRAAMRTNQRILRIQEEQAMRELEAQMVADEPEEVVVAPAPKKG